MPLAHATIIRIRQHDVVGGRRPDGSLDTPEIQLVINTPKTGAHSRSPTCAMASILAIPREIRSVAS